VCFLLRTDVSIPILLSYFYQRTAAEAAAAEPYCPEEGIAFASVEMIEEVCYCYWTYHYNCPKCGTSVSVSVRDAKQLEHYHDARAKDDDRPAIQIRCSRCEGPIALSWGGHYHEPQNKNKIRHNTSLGGTSGGGTYDGGGGGNTYDGGWFGGGGDGGGDGGGGGGGDGGGGGGGE